MPNQLEKNNSKTPITKRTKKFVKSTKMKSEKAGKGEEKPKDPQIVDYIGKNVSFGILK